MFNALPKKEVRTRKASVKDIFKRCLFKQMHRCFDFYMAWSSSLFFVFQNNSFVIFGILRLQEARTMICFTQKLNRRISLRIRTFLSPIRTDNSYADAPDQEKHQQFQLEHVTVKRVSQSAAARGYRLRCLSASVPLVFWTWCCGGCNEKELTNCYTSPRTLHHDAMRSKFMLKFITELKSV